MRHQRITFHLTDTHTAFIGTAFQRLVSHGLARTCCAVVDLVLHHVLHALVIRGSHKHIHFHLLAIHTVVQDLATEWLKSLRHQNLLERVDPVHGCTRCGVDEGALFEC